MAFFKRYNGSTNARLVRIERLVWVLIYAGLLAVVISHFLGDADAVLAQAMVIGGVLSVVSGVALVVVRSRMQDGDAGGD